MSWDVGKMGDQNNSNTLKNHKSIQLKVAEAIQDDVNKGIIRIDSAVIQELKINTGGIIELTGGRKTVAIVDRSYPGDIGLNIIRMDGITRRNAKTSIGELINISVADVVPAIKVTVAPAHNRSPVRAPAEFFKQGLLGRVVINGDIVSLGGAKSRRNAMIDSPMAEMLNSIDKNLMGFGLSDVKFNIIKCNPKTAVIINDATEIEILSENVEVTEEEKLPVISYEDVGGLRDEIEKIREMVELPLKYPEIFERLGVDAPKGVLLHGPPGTGKTLIARAVASETNTNFFVINGPEIMSKYYGQSEENLRKKFEEAEENGPSIIFIDEIDAIASKREDSKGEVERRVVAQLLALMDGLKTRGNIIVIAATNIPNNIDPALRRPGRFDREIEIGVPSKKGRINILKIHTRNMPLAKDVVIEDIAEITHGFVGADLQSLAKEAAMIVLRRILPNINLDDHVELPKEILEKLEVSRADFIDALKTVRPSAMREVLVEIPNISWDDVGGLASVKQELKEAVEWPLKNPNSFKRLGITPPKGILLYGAPGTGKTLLAKAIATESKANFIVVKGPELMSKWQGESEKAVRKIFAKARQTAPTIIFFDEIDSITPSRSISSDSKSSEKVVNQLLTELDGVETLNNVVVIGATNRPDVMDTALLRPGRFDRIIQTPVPDEKTRLKILKIHTNKMPLAEDVNFEIIAKKTLGYVGADLESLVREAGIMALRKDINVEIVSMANFNEALEKVKPSVTPEIEEAYKDLRKYFRTARGEELKAERPSYMG